MDKPRPDYYSSNGLIEGGFLTISSNVLLVLYILGELYHILPPEIDGTKGMLLVLVVPVLNLVTLSKWSKMWENDVHELELYASNIKDSE